MLFCLVDWKRAREKENNREWVFQVGWVGCCKKGKGKKEKKETEWRFEAGPFWLIGKCRELIGVERSLDQIRSSLLWLLGIGKRQERKGTGEKKCWSFEFGPVWCCVKVGEKRGKRKRRGFWSRPNRLLESVGEKREQRHKWDCDLDPILVSEKRWEK